MLAKNYLFNYFSVTPSCNTEPHGIRGLQPITQTWLLKLLFLKYPPSTCAATPPDLSKKYPLGAGFRRLSTSPQRQASAQPEPPGVVRRGAEITTHLARRRGGGTTARDKAQLTWPGQNRTKTVRTASVICFPWIVGSPDQSGRSYRFGGREKLWIASGRAYYWESAILAGSLHHADSTATDIPSNPYDESGRQKS